MSRYKYGLKKDLEDERDLFFTKDFLMKQKVELPDSVDLRAKMPPIWNQGNLGSCQSHAADAPVSVFYNNSFDPSRIFTYYNVRALEDTIDEDSGGTLRDTIKAVAKYGVCDSKFWSNDINEFAEKPSQDAYDNAKNYNISNYNYHRLINRDEILQALAMGFIPIIGINVYESMESDECIETGKIPMPKKGEQLLGGHALCIVAYHLNKNNKSNCILNKIFGKKESAGSYILRNSWGNVGINHSGYFSITFETLDKLLMDAWVICK